MSSKDNEMEKDFLEALNKNQLKKSKQAAQELKTAKAAANRYLKKDNRINIRISGTDLTLLKRKAAQEGMPYQTLIASVLHKFVAGSLMSKG